MDNGVLRKTALNQLLVGEKKRMLIRTRTDPPPPKGFISPYFWTKSLTNTVGSFIDVRMSSVG